MPRRQGLDSNYYEELGVAENASSAELRDAFRALVRLLHPDHQTNPELKAMAERHMRRLNGIYAVLSDPAKRSDYDARLDEDPAAAIVFNPSSNIDPRRFVSRFLWMGALLILGGACLWMFVDGVEPASSAPVDRSTTLLRAAAPAPRSDASVTSNPEIEALQAELRIIRSERDAARYELGRLRASLATRDEEIHSPAIITRAPQVTAPPADPLPVEKVSPRGLLASNVLPSLPRPTVRPLGSDPHQFAGFWFFVQTGGSANKNLYPPQFIEATLTERNGLIHGIYRSRYRIVDRAISPDVNFEFSGPATGPSLVTPWTGPGGAKGQVTVTLTNENSLKLDWTASDVGSLQGLASGTATLTRRIE